MIKGKESQLDSTIQFEDLLAHSLDEVKPDPRFVGRLQQKLTHKSEIELEKKPFIAVYMILGIGLFSGVLLFWLIAQIFRGVKALVLRP